MINVALCIPTCNRPDMLDHCLKKINELNVDTNKYQVEVIIVDNGSKDPAESIYNSVTADSRFAYSYHTENKKGLVFVRNRCIDIAVEKQCDYLVFLDDDEYPEETWLSSLLAFAVENNAEIVTGPVISDFSGITCKPWIYNCTLFSRFSQSRSATVDFFVTNNLLLSTKMLQNTGVRFDETLNFSGGEDTDLAIRLRQKNKTIYWCGTATVSEIIPESRCASNWIFLRYFRLASNWVYFKHKYKLHRIPRIRSVINGTVHIISGLPLFLTSLFFQQFTGEAIRKIASGCGLIAGSFGIKYQEYKKHHQ